MTSRLFFVFVSKAINEVYGICRLPLLKRTAKSFWQELLQHVKPCRAALAVQWGGGFLHRRTNKHFSDCSNTCIRKILGHIQFQGLNQKGHCVHFSCFPPSFTCPTVFHSCAKLNDRTILTWISSSKRGLTSGRGGSACPSGSIRRMRRLALLGRTSFSFGFLFSHRMQSNRI